MKTVDIPVQAYTIAQFCMGHGGISRTHYYSMRKAGMAPCEMRVGGRVLISIEAAAEWRALMERVPQAPDNDNNMENL